MKNKKCCQGALQRELATAFTWDDVKTESALLYRPHSVRLIAAALYRPKDKSVGVTRRMCCGCNLHERWIYFMFMKLYWSSSAGDKATIASACMHVLCVCVCVREQLINHVAAGTPHSSSLKDDYLLSLQMTTAMMYSPVLFWCVRTRTGSWLDGPQQRWHAQRLQIYAALSLFCQAHICTEVLCEQRGVRYVIMVTVYFTTSSGLGAS